MRVDRLLLYLMVLVLAIVAQLAILRAFDMILRRASWAGVVLVPLAAYIAAGIGFLPAGKDRGGDAGRVASVSLLMAITVGWGIRRANEARRARNGR